MTPPNLLVGKRPPTALLGLTLAFGILWGGLASVQAAAASSTSGQAWPVRNFLPPIASINPKLTEQQTDSAENSLEPVALSAISSPVIHTTPKVNRLATPLDVAVKDEKSLALLEIQRKVNEADLEHLWQATVEKNPVIRFSLEKLATPADLQAKQSSKFLSKSLNVLISGATMGATMLPGASAYRNMGAMSVGNMLQNLTTGNTKPAPNTLSPTEQIQLAGLIDELKLKLINNYQDYKSTLQALAEAREITMKNNNLYSKALASKSDLGVMAAGSAYYQALMHETTLRQKAKLYRLQLERIAGADAVSSLELSPRVSLESKPTSSAEEIGPSPELKTSAEVLKPPKSATSPNEALTLPQAMEIGPSLGSDSELIGPPLPALLSTTSHSVKTRRAMVKNTGDNLPQPIPDKIMGHSANPSLPSSERQPEHQQEKSQP